ncbi:hypothetical protein F4804DRAFT_350737 [Jackrogersella minutella]|nr:hypothetical protein F4804DRAFT_350737 [Jackrogersella minutella]
MYNQPPSVEDGLTWAIAAATGGFFAIAIYNSIEIYFLIFHTFRRKNTPYFWTIMAANTGIIIHETAALGLFHLAPALVMAVTASIGWWLMTTGQSVILYLRLHLVMQDRRKLRAVLILIAATFVTMQIPATIAFLALMSVPPKNKPIFANLFGVFKVIQLVGFTIQESLISALYVWAFKKTSQRLSMVREDRIRKMLYELVGLFLVILLLDIVLVIDETVGDFRVQTTLKPAVYSIKLKVELLVLNNLVSWMQSPSNASGNSSYGQGQRQRTPLDRLSSGQSGRTAVSEATAPWTPPPPVSSPDPDAGVVKPPVARRTTFVEENDEKPDSRNRSSGSHENEMT